MAKIANLAFSEILSCWIACAADAATSSVASVELEEVDGCGDGVSTLSLSACGAGVTGRGCMSVADQSLCCPQCFADWLCDG